MLLRSQLILCSSPEKQRNTECCPTGSLLPSGNGVRTRQSIKIWTVTVTITTQGSLSYIYSSKLLWWSLMNSSSFICFILFCFVPLKSWVSWAWLFCGSWKHKTKTNQGNPQLANLGTSLGGFQQPGQEGDVPTYSRGLEPDNCKGPFQFKVFCESMILGIDLVDVKLLESINLPWVSTRLSACTPNSPPPRHMTDGTVLWAVPLPAEGIPLNSRFTALKGCPWREEQHFKVS